MSDILLYVFIILVGFTISKKNLIPDLILKKIAHFQNISLFILLGFMGYKIGADKKLIRSLPSIGLQAFSIAAVSILFSVALTYLFYKRRGGK